MNENPKTTDNIIAEYTRIIQKEQAATEAKIGAAAAGGKTVMVGKDVYDDFATIRNQALERAYLEKALSGGNWVTTGNKTLGVPSPPYDPLTQTVRVADRHMEGIEREVQQAIRQANKAEQAALRLEQHNRDLAIVLESLKGTDAGQDAILAGYANELHRLTHLCDKQAQQIAALQDRVDLIDSDLVLARKG